MKWFSVAALLLMVVAAAIATPPSIQWDYAPPWNPLNKPCPTCQGTRQPRSSRPSPSVSHEDLIPGVPRKLIPNGRSTIVKMASENIETADNGSVQLVYIPEGRLVSLANKGLARMVTEESKSFVTYSPAPTATIAQYSDKQKRDHRGQVITGAPKTNSFPMTLVAEEGKEETAKEQLQLLEAALSSPQATESANGQLPRVFIAPSNIPPPPGYVKIPLVPQKQAESASTKLPSTFLTHSNPHPLPPGFVRLSLPSSVSHLSKDIPLVKSNRLQPESNSLTAEPTPRGAAVGRLPQPPPPRFDFRGNVAQHVSLELPNDKREVSQQDQQFHRANNQVFPPQFINQRPPPRNVIHVIHNQAGTTNIRHNSQNTRQQNVNNERNVNDQNNRNRPKDGGRFPSQGSTNQESGSFNSGPRIISNTKKSPAPLLVNSSPAPASKFEQQLRLQEFNRQHRPSASASSGAGSSKTAFKNTNIGRPIIITQQQFERLNGDVSQFTANVQQHQQQVSSHPRPSHNQNNDGPSSFSSQSLSQQSNRNNNGLQQRPVLSGDRFTQNIQSARRPSSTQQAFSPLPNSINQKQILDIVQATGQGGRIETSSPRPFNSNTNRDQKPPIRRVPNVQGSVQQSGIKIISKGEPKPEEKHSSTPRPIVVNSSNSPVNSPSNSFVQSSTRAPQFFPSPNSSSNFNIRPAIGTPANVPFQQRNKSSSNSVGIPPPHDPRFNEMIKKQNNDLRESELSDNGETLLRLKPVPAQKQGGVFQNNQVNFIHRQPESPKQPSPPNQLNKPVTFSQSGKSTRVQLHSNVRVNEEKRISDNAGSKERTQKNSNTESQFGDNVIPGSVEQQETTPSPPTRHQHQSTFAPNGRRPRPTTFAPTTVFPRITTFAPPRPFFLSSVAPTRGSSENSDTFASDSSSRFPSSTIRPLSVSSTTSKERPTTENPAFNITPRPHISTTQFPNSNSGNVGPFKVQPFSNSFGFSQSLTGGFVNSAPFNSHTAFEKARDEAMRPFLSSASKIPQPIPTRNSETFRNSSPERFLTSTPGPFRSSSPESFRSTTLESFPNSIPESFRSTTLEPFQNSSPESFRSTTLEPIQNSSPKSFRSSTLEPSRTTSPQPFRSSTSEPFGSTSSERFRSSTPEPFRSTSPNSFHSSTEQPFRSSTLDPFPSSTREPFRSSTLEPFRSSTLGPFRSSTPEPFRGFTSDPFRSSSVRPAHSFSQGRVPTSSRERFQSTTPESIRSSTFDGPQSFPTSPQPQPVSFSQPRFELSQSSPSTSPEPSESFSHELHRGLPRSNTGFRSQERDFTTPSTDVLSHSPRPFKFNNNEVFPNNVQVRPHAFSNDNFRIQPQPQRVFLSPQNLDNEEENLLLDSTTTSTSDQKKVNAIRVTTFKPRFSFTKPTEKSTTKTTTTTESATVSPVDTIGETTLFPPFSVARRRQRLNKKEEKTEDTNEEPQKKAQPFIFGRRLRPRVRQQENGDQNAAGTNTRVSNAIRTTTIQPTAFKSRLSISSRLRNRGRGRTTSAPEIISTTEASLPEEVLEATDAPIDAPIDTETTTSVSVKPGRRSQTFKQLQAESNTDNAQEPRRRRPGSRRVPQWLRERRQRLRKKLSTTESPQEGAIIDDPPIDFIDDNAFSVAESARVTITQPSGNVLVHNQEPRIIVDEANATPSGEYIESHAVEDTISYTDVPDSVRLEQTPSATTEISNNEEKSISEITESNFEVDDEPTFPSIVTEVADISDSSNHRRDPQIVRQQIGSSVVPAQSTEYVKEAKYTLLNQQSDELTILHTTRDQVGFPTLHVPDTTQTDYRHPYASDFLSAMHANVAEDNDSAREETGQTFSDSTHKRGDDLDSFNLDILSQSHDESNSTVHKSDESKDKHDVSLVTVQPIIPVPIDDNIGVVHTTSGNSEYISAEQFRNTAHKLVPYTNSNAASSANEPSDREESFLSSYDDDVNINGRTFPSGEPEDIAGSIYDNIEYSDYPEGDSAFAESRTHIVYAVAPSEIVEKHEPIIHNGEDLEVTTMTQDEESEVTTASNVPDIETQTDNSNDFTEVFRTVADGFKRAEETQKAADTADTTDTIQTTDETSAATAVEITTEEITDVTSQPVLSTEAPGGTVLGRSTVLEIRSSEPTICFSNGRCIKTKNFGR